MRTYLPFVLGVVSAVSAFKHWEDERLVRAFVRHSKHHFHDTKHSGFHWERPRLSPRRHHRYLGDSFRLTFTNRTEVLKYFEEGDEHLTTGGSSSCARPDHLEYNVTLPDCGCSGLKVRMDNKNATCAQRVAISTGHLASIVYYTYGDFEIRARIAHSVDGRDPPSNAFTCFSAYTGARESKAGYHNEIALCWPGSDTKKIHMGYWYGTDGDKEHRYDHDLGFDAAEGYHTYKFKWRNDSITYEIDDKEVHKATGSKDKLPFEDLSIRVILRPNNKPSTYLGEAMYGVDYISYTVA